MQLDRLTSSIETDIDTSPPPSVASVKDAELRRQAVEQLESVARDQAPAYWRISFSLFGVLTTLRTCKRYFPADFKDQVCPMLSALDDIPSSVPWQTVTAASAIGGAVSVGTGGAVAGGTLGGVGGLLLAPLTFGMSIPVGVAVGSGCGAVTGTAIGGSVCAAAGYVAHTKSDTILSFLRQKFQKMDKTQLMIADVDPKFHKLHKEPLKNEALANLPLTNEPLKIKTSWFPDISKHVRWNRADAGARELEKQRQIDELEELNKELVRQKQLRNFTEVRLAQTTSENGKLKRDMEISKKELDRAQRKLREISGKINQKIKAFTARLPLPSASRLSGSASTSMLPSATTSSLLHNGSRTGLLQSTTSMAHLLTASQASIGSSSPACNSPVLTSGSEAQSPEANVPGLDLASHLRLVQSGQITYDDSEEELLSAAPLQ